MSASPASFLLVDDHALFRTGLGLMLSQTWPDALVAQAASWGEALVALQHARPSLVMLDVHLPDGHGLADLSALQALAPGCAVMLMSAEADAIQVQRAREAGAIGFLPKSASAAAVLEAVRSALAGQQAFAAVPYSALGGGVAASQADPSTWRVREAGPQLSERQRDILRFLGRATPNKAIARQMGMSEADVRAEVSWLTESLGASSREQAYAEAVARGMVQP
ncbi:MAG: response regulator transcription factor [Aquabacterium sp.]